MMGSYSPGDVTGVYALLAAITDPKKAKEALDALIAAYEKNAAAMKNLIDEKAAFAKEIAAAEKKHADQRKDALDRSEKADKEAATAAEAMRAANAAEARLRQAQEALAEEEGKLAVAKENFVYERDKFAEQMKSQTVALRAREEKLAELEAKAQADAKSAAEMKELYEKRLAKLKDAVGG